MNYSDYFEDVGHTVRWRQVTHPSRRHLLGTLATAAQNLHNSRRTSRNTSGVKGLSYSRTRGVWVGAIHRLGKAHKFQSKCREDVEAWLQATRKQLHGEFSRYE